MKPFVPDKLSIQKIKWEPLIELIGKANRSIGLFQGTLKAIVNSDLLLSPLTVKEAVLSSKIEGTQATLQEVLLFEAEQKKYIPKDNDTQKIINKYNDIQEVINYRKALQKSVELLNKKPMNLNAIKTIHSILLNSVRGQNKARGEFRKVQNWVGKPMSDVSNASYIPPDPSYLMQYLSDWEKYWHSEEKDKIVQLAIIHAQFEIIHPFLDGNGRIGRIFIPLFLFEHKLLSAPVFYMSEYLEIHREEYYSRLSNISSEGDWNGWIEFFLKAFISQAEENKIKAEKILNLYEDMKMEIDKLHTTFALPAIDTLFKKAIFNTNDFISFSGIPKSSAHRLLNQLAEKGILKIREKGVKNASSIYVFSALINVTR
ncbi:MAG: Fic family protein [bacterium]